MNNVVSNLIMVLSILFTLPSWASSISNASITKLMNDRNYLNYTYIKLDSGPSRIEGHCSSNTTWDFVLNTEDEFGKLMHSQLLAAFAAGKTVILAGNGDCSVGSTENLRRVEVY